MTRPIDFYFDFISPYAYLAATKIDVLAAKHGRDVDWHPFLMGVTVMQVMGLKPIMETPLKSDYALIDRPRMARLMNVPLTIPEIDGLNSVAASRAYYWIREKNPELAKEFARRVFNRLWVQGRDITDVDAVSEEVDTLGVDTKELRAALEDDRVKGLLRVAVEAAVERKVFGSPFFIIDDEPIWGADRFWMVEHWLKHGNWDPAPE